MERATDSSLSKTTTDAPAAAHRPATARPIGVPASVTTTTRPDIGPGAAVMGDFWHMQLEETSFMGAFICAGSLLKHVHIAGLKQRIIPGVHRDADVYVDGFKGLKLLGYRGAVSFEGGWPKDPAQPKNRLPEEKQIVLTRDMVSLLREQREMA